jgi:ABC-type multidrug transport system ATPase subunit
MERCLNHQGSQLYEDLSFQIKDGQRLIILGPSGAGKTTLIRALAGQRGGRWWIFLGLWWVLVAGFV